MENNKYTKPNLRFATVGGGKNAQPLANKDDCSIDNVEKSVPKLRFGEFDGEWEFPLIKDVFEIRNGYTPSKEVSRFWEGGTIPWFRMEDIRENGGILQDSIQHITPLGLKGTGLFEKGSIILATTATIGVHAMLIADSLANQRFTNFKIRKSLTDDYDQYFVYYSFFGIDEWSKRNSNSGGLLAVDIPSLLRTEYKAPSLSEQQKIASYFTSLDQQIKAATKRVASLKQVKAACLQSMFPQEGETVPKVRFQGFEGEWKERKLGEIADIYQPQTIGSECFTEKGYDVYGANGIIGKYPKYNHLTNQSMIACRGSNCGVVNCSIGKCWINGNAMVVNVDNYNVEKTFILFVLQRQDFTSIITGSGQPQIVREPLLQWNIIIPYSIDEQQKIATFFTTLDKQIGLESQRLEKLKQVKKACLDKMFV